MRDMNRLVRKENIITYPSNALIMLDNKVVHRVSTDSKFSLRNFVKISVSKDIYNLKGNAHNYLFDYDWKMIDRKSERNLTKA
jgi:hypothetical protein